MILTYFTTANGGAVVSKQILCPFCGLLPIPRNWGADAAYRWLEFTHFLDHVDEIAAYQPEPVTCARCKRVPLDSDVPHRACYLAECECPCSYPAPPTDLTPRFEEAE